MNLKRLTARVAGYMDSITAARRAGMTWGELATLFCAPSGEALRKAFARARQGIQEGRLVPIEQLPLPISVPAPKPSPPALSRDGTRATPTALPTRPGFTKIDIDK